MVSQEVVKLPPDFARLACQNAGDLTKREAICWVKRNLETNIRYKQVSVKQEYMHSAAEPVMKLMCIRDPMYWCCVLHAPVDLLDFCSSSAQTEPNRDFTFTFISAVIDQLSFTRMSAVSRLKFVQCHLLEHDM